MRISLGLICAVLLAGCGAPSAALLPNVEPRGEALAYFGPDAPAVALVETDPDAPGVHAFLSALVRAGAYGRVRVATKERGLIPRQVRRLLGGELVVGIPQPGAPLLAAMVTEDGGELRTLAESRVVGGRATVAGTYRGASLYRAHDHAFAVRGRVLLVSRATADLRDALDRRASDDTFKTEDLERALPKVSGEPLVRAFANLDARIGPRGRTVPWLAALETLGVVVRAGEQSARIDFRVTTTADDLLEVDVPVSPGKRGPLAVTAPSPALAVRDLAHTLGVAERAARVAFPLAFLRLDQARRTLRAEGQVDIDEDVLARLHGPATIVRTHDAFLLRADPSRPRALREALQRLARSLPGALDRARLKGFRVREYGGFYELVRDGRVVGRAGMRAGVLVAGNGTPRALRALARAPLARPAGASGGLTVAIPEQSAAELTEDVAGVPLPWRLDGWARGARDGLRGALHVAW